MAIATFDAVQVCRWTKPSRCCCLASNPTYLAHTDCSIPCAAVRGDDLREGSSAIVRGGEGILPWLRRLVAVAAARDARCLRHLPFPAVALPPQSTDDPNHPIPAAVTHIAAGVLASSDRLPVSADVSIIICTKDCGHLLTQLVLHLLQPGLGRVKEVILVLNQPRNAFARAFHAELAKLDRVRIVDYPLAYNFSDQCNIGARQATGLHLLFLNDDVVPVGDRWLGTMLDSFADADVAVVGPLLLYPDETVQHAGMFLGFNNVAGHRLRGVRLPGHGMAGDLVPIDCSAVTGAVMLVRADVFAALNGFDYQLATYLQDLDLCLRVLRLGRRIMFNPGAVLFHMESISAATMLREQSVLERRGREHQRFVQRWGSSIAIDRFHNVNWDKQDESMGTLTSVGRSTLRAVLNG